jgi:regulator of replication initiation timing
MITADVTFKGLKKRIDSLEKKTESKGIVNSVMNFTAEKSLKFAISYFNKNIDKIGNFASIKKQVLSTNGDIKKLDQRLYSVLAEYGKRANDIISDYKGNDNICKYSVIAFYKQIWDALNESKNKALFNRAITEYKNNSKKPPSMSIVWTILYVVYVMFLITMIMMFIGIWMGERSITAKEFESFLENAQLSNKATLNAIGIPAIEMYWFLKNQKNPLASLNDNIKKSKEAFDDIIKAKESHTIPDLSKYDIGYIQTQELMKKRSTEDIMGLLLVGISIAGIVVIIELIRRALYWIGSIKVDIVENIIKENEVLKINIRELKERYERCTDPKEKKKLQEIIEKQEKWQRDFEIYIEKNKISSNEAYIDSDEQIKSEDESASNDSGDNENYPVII